MRESRWSCVCINCTSMNGFTLTRTKLVKYSQALTPYPWKQWKCVPRSGFQLFPEIPASSGVYRKWRWQSLNRESSRRFTVKCVENKAEENKEGRSTTNGEAVVRKSLWRNVKGEYWGYERKRERGRESRLRHWDRKGKFLNSFSVY